jgi:hypothetical protein
MVVKFETSNLKTLEFEPYIVIWTCSNSRTYQHWIRLMWGGYLYLCQILIGYQTGYMHICPLGLLFQKSKPPPFTWQFLKGNTRPHLITDDLKNLNIHNQTPLEENNNVGCLSKIRINNHFTFRLCNLQTERKKEFFKFI